MRPCSFIPAILSVLALGVAACGDGDDGGGKTEIARDIKLSFTTQDEKVFCGQLATKSFVKRFYGEMAQCLEKVRRLEIVRSEADDKPTRDVRVSNITVDGNAARGRAQFVGGEDDGTAGTVEVRKEGDRWPIDDLGSDLQRSLLQPQLVRGLENTRFDKPVIRACVKKRLSDLPDDRFQRIAYGYAHRKGSAEDDAAQQEFTTQLLICYARDARARRGEGSAGQP